MLLRHDEFLRRNSLFLFVFFRTASFFLGNIASSSFARRILSYEKSCSLRLIILPLLLLLLLLLIRLLLLLLLFTASSFLGAVSPDASSRRVSS